MEINCRTTSTWHVRGRCPIRNFLRVRGSADLRTLTYWWTGSGQEIHDKVRVPDKIQRNLRVSDGREHPLNGDTLGFDDGEILDALLQMLDLPRLLSTASGTR